MPRLGASPARHAYAAVKAPARHARPRGCADSPHESLASRVRRLGPGRAPGPSRAPLVRPPHAARAASEREPPRATPRPDSGWCTRGLRPCTLSSILVRPVIPAPSSPPPSPGHCETPRYCNDDGPGPGGRGARRGRVARECSEGAGGLVLEGDAWGDGWRSRVGPDRSLPTGRRHGAGCAGRRLTRMLRDAWRDGGVPGGARRGSPAVIVIEREREREREEHACRSTSRIAQCPSRAASLSGVPPHRSTRFTSAPCTPRRRRRRHGIPPPSGMAPRAIRAEGWSAARHGCGKKCRERRLIRDKIAESQDC